MKKVFKSLIILITIFSFHNVYADTSNVDISIKSLQLAGMTYSTVQTLKNEGTTYLGVSSTNQADLLSNYSIFNLNTTFDKNVDRIGFFYWNSSLYYGNSTTVNDKYDSIEVIPPLVRLNSKSCSVKPIGTSTMTTSDYGWRYASYFWVECDVIQSSSYSINVRYIPKDAQTKLNVGISKNFVLWSDTDTQKKVYDEIQKSNEISQDIKDNITSSDTSSSQEQADGFFKNFQSNDYGLSDIITMPLTLIKSLTNSTCVALQLKVPFLDNNNTLELPCMDTIYKKHFGTFYTIYQTIIFGFIAYWVSVRIYALVKGFKNPDDDKVEVLDL